MHLHKMLPKSKNLRIELIPENVYPICFVNLFHMRQNIGQQMVDNHLAERTSNKNITKVLYEYSKNRKCV